MIEPIYAFQRTYVSPELAKELLANSGPNRVVSLTQARRYSEALAAGRWDNNAPALIIIDDQGQLRDGQHRCHGSVKSGVGFWAIMVTGMPAASFAVLDTGMRRTAAQVLAIAGIPYASVSASASKYAMNYIGGVGLRNGRDNDEIRAFVQEHATIPAVAQKCFPVRKKFGPSPFAAVMFLASHDKGLSRQIEKFVTGVADPAATDHKPGDPRLLLREWADRELARQKGAVIRPEPLMMATSRAWNAFAEGRSLQAARELTSQQSAHRDTMPIKGYVHAA